MKLYKSKQIVKDDIATDIKVSAFVAEQTPFLELLPSGKFSWKRYSKTVHVRYIFFLRIVKHMTAFANYLRCTKNRQAWFKRLPQETRVHVRSDLHVLHAAIRCTVSYIYYISYILICKLCYEVVRFKIRNLTWAILRKYTEKHMYTLKLT